MNAVRAHNLRALQIRIFAAFGGRPPRRGKRPPKQLYPHNAEMTYLQHILSIMRDCHELVSKVVMPELTAILNDARRTQGHADSARADDDYTDEVKRIFETVRREARAKIGQRPKVIATEAEGQIQRFNREQVAKQIKSVIGVDVLQAEPYLQPLAKAFVAQNVSLIESIPSRYFDELEGLVLQAARSGRRSEALAQDLEDRYDVSESRAKLIARSETAKLNGQITQVRQTNLGVEEFVWRTSEDERVRPSHAALDGKTFEWKDPPASEGIPGEAPNCRCTAEPVLDPLLGDET